MTGRVEHSEERRGRGTFPAHWKGIQDGQTVGERSAVIIENMARDAEARGDHAKAHEVRDAYRTAGQSKRSASAALEKARRLA